MEIPYEVKPRPDTGLWNAKIGIWLFLASEVMLFGGLFSGYVFLRLGSGADPDYHWPHGLLDVKLGFINTLVLIASSVFIVMAWVQLKLRNWKKYKIWMSLVLLCALAFLVIKSFEYKAKFEHYGVDLVDKTLIEGHDLEDQIVYNDIDQITIPLDYTTLAVNDIVHSKMRGQLKFSIMPDKEPDENGMGGYVGLLTEQKAKPEKKFKEIFPNIEYAPTTDEREAINAAYKKVVENTKGEFELDRSKLKQIKKAVDAHNRALLKPIERIRQIEYPIYRQEMKGVEEMTDDQRNRLILLSKPQVWYPKQGLESIKFKPNEPFSIATKRSKLRAFAEGSGTLYDQTSFVGNLSEEERFLYLHVDNIDLRNLKNPEDSIVWQYMGDDGEAAKASFLKHKKEAEEKAEADGEEPLLEKTMMQHLNKDDFHGHYPTVKIPLDQVKTYSNFTPKRNTYLAIYFTLTGLHGLHVLVGALVLAYFLFFGKKMFDEDPEHLANRVEVGGLFWHFVDLVWIFLFPILYLM